MQITKINKIDFFVYFICFFFFVIGTIISLNRFWQYDVSMVDFGQYDQALWHISRFQAPMTDHFIHGYINVLGDHVTPSIFLLAPLYWFTNRSEIILVAQSLIVALSGFFLYDLAKTILKNRFLSLSILICYFLFVGLQNAVITEFHELTVMTLPLMVTFWAMVKNKKITYFTAFIITLGCKEVTFLLGISIGVAIFFLKKKWRKESIWTIVLSVAWGLLALKVIIPFFNHGTYLYANSLPNGILPKAYALIDQPLKRQTLLFSFLSFSFLPLLSPPFWLAMLQDYATRFLPADFVTRWGLGLHYNAQSAVLLSVGSVFGLAWLLNFKIFKRFASLIAVVMILNALVLFRFVLHGPFLLAFNNAFYQHTNDFVFLNTIIDKVPPNVSVMTQNNLGPRFTHQDVKLLSNDYTTTKPDYILFDLRAGQNPNDFFGTAEFDRVSHAVLGDRDYKVVYKSDYQYVLKRKF